MKNIHRSLYLSALSEARRAREITCPCSPEIQRSRELGSGWRRRRAQGGRAAARAERRGCGARGARPAPQRSPGGSSLPVIHAPSSVGKRDPARHGSGTERRRKRLPHPSQLSPFPKLVRAIWILQPELRSGSGRVVRIIATLHSQAPHPPFFFSEWFPFP